MTTLYGIKNCDTVKKARQWLDNHDVTYTFVDIRGDGFDPALIRRWVEAVGWETLLNRRSLSWKQLSANERDGIDKTRAIALMEANPTLVKRPVLDHKNVIHVGFKAPDFEALFVN